jgi:hypothetical protein
LDKEKETVKNQVIAIEDLGSKLGKEKKALQDQEALSKKKDGEIAGLNHDKEILQSKEIIEI